MPFDRCFVESRREDFLRNRHSFAWNGFFGQRVATGNFYCIVFQIASSHSQPHGNAFQFIFRKLPPRLLLSALSYFTLMPNVFSCCMILSTFSSIFRSCSLFLYIGTITTCKGARVGGRTRPLSSECDMMSAPINRVETPHEVAHT